MYLFLLYELNEEIGVTWNYQRCHFIGRQFDQ